ncbi:MAG TPA: adenylate kinase [Candidatus Thermoplasmatota archaeon]|jgi:adenylate kinase|nr:adenylate kinase [Candidatus Thermoplasmatota archaeon]
MGVVVITGVPGVGKSTVIEAARKHKGYKVVVYGTEMFNVAVARGLVKDRDEMRRLDPAVQRDIQVKAAEAIAAMGDVIVDTHCTIKTPRGYLPGLPAWVVQQLNPKQIILVEATPEEIAKRRTNDATRKRDEDSVAAIAEHQLINRMAAMGVATLTGATVHTIHNHEGKVDETRDAVIRSIA